MHWNFQSVKCGARCWKKKLVSRSRIPRKGSKFENKFWTWYSLLMNTTNFVWYSLIVCSTQTGCFITIVKKQVWALIIQACKYIPTGPHTIQQILGLKPGELDELSQLAVPAQAGCKWQELWTEDPLEDCTVRAVPIDFCWLMSQ